MLVIEEYPNNNAWKTELLRENNADNNWQDEYFSYRYVFVENNVELFSVMIDTGVEKWKDIYLNHVENEVNIEFLSDDNIENISDMVFGYIKNSIEKILKIWKKKDISKTNIRILIKGNKKGTLVSAKIGQKLNIWIKNHLLLDDNSIRIQLMQYNPVSELSFTEDIHTTIVYYMCEKYWFFYVPKKMKRIDHIIVIPVDVRDDICFEHEKSIRWITEMQNGVYIVNEYNLLKYISKYELLKSILDNSLEFQKIEFERTEMIKEVAWMWFECYADIVKKEYCIETANEQDRLFENINDIIGELNRILNRQINIMDKYSLQIEYKSICEVYDELIWNCRHYIIFPQKQKLYRYEIKKELVKSILDFSVKQIKNLQVLIEKLNVKIYSYRLDYGNKQNNVSWYHLLLYSSMLNVEDGVEKVSKDSMIIDYKGKKIIFTEKNESCNEKQVAYYNILTLMGIESLYYKPYHLNVTWKNKNKNGIGFEIENDEQIHNNNVFFEKELVLLVDYLFGKNKLNLCKIECDKNFFFSDTAIGCYMINEEMNIELKKMSEKLYYKIVELTPEMLEWCMCKMIDKKEKHAILKKFKVLQEWMKKKCCTVPNFLGESC